MQIQNKENDLLMSIDLDIVTDPSDIQSSWLNWIQSFLNIMDECIPCSILQNRKNFPWLTKDLVKSEKEPLIQESLEVQCLQLLML